MSAAGRETSESSTPSFEVRPLSDPSDPKWRRLLEAHPLTRSVVPTWETLAGWVPQPIGVYSDGELVGGMLLGERRAPGPLPVSVARVPLVLLGPRHQAAMLVALFAHLEQVARSRRILEIEFRLHIPANEAVPGFEYQIEFWRAFERFGYRMLRGQDHTYFVDIQRTDEELFQSFKPEIKRKIRQAEKAHVHIESTQDHRILEIFHQNYLETVERKGAPLYPRGHIVEGLRPLLADGRIVVLTARYDDVLANILVLDALGIPEYMLGTRTHESVLRAVSSAGHILQYEAMRRMRDLGKPFYNLGGAEGPRPIPGHPNYGVWRFKAGFQGVYVDFLPYFRKSFGARSERVLNLLHRLLGD